MKTWLKNQLRQVGIELHFIPSAQRIKELTTAPMQELRWLQELPIRTVLDIGANTGQFSRGIHQLLPNAQIYAFEPLPDCHAELVKDFASVPNFQAFNTALGTTNGQVQIHRNQFSPASSLLPLTELHKTTFAYAQESIVQEVQISRLDDLGHTLDLKDPFLIKVDVQGFEEQVIEGGMAIFQKATVVIIELSIVPLYEGQPLFDAIYQKLTTMGFEYRGNYDQAHDAQGRVLYVDSVFTKGISFE